MTRISTAINKGEFRYVSRKSYVESMSMFRLYFHFHQVVHQVVHQVGESNRPIKPMSFSFSSISLRFSSTGFEFRIIVTSPRCVASYLTTMSTFSSWPSQA